MKLIVNGKKVKVGSLNEASELYLKAYANNGKGASDIISKEEGNILLHNEVIAEVSYNGNVVMDNIIVLTKAKLYNGVIKRTDTTAYYLSSILIYSEEIEFCINNDLKAIIKRRYGIDGYEVDILDIDTNEINEKLGGIVESDDEKDAINYAYDFA